MDDLADREKETNDLIDMARELKALHPEVHASAEELAKLLCSFERIRDDLAELRYLEEELRYLEEKEWLRTHCSGCKCGRQGPHPF